MRRQRGAPVKHIRDTIEELRRYIAENDSDNILEEVDILLSVALEYVRRKLAEARRAGKSPDLSGEE
jgi:hypothetical protein